MNGLVSSLSAQGSLGYFLIRVLTGAILAISGYSKLFIMGMNGTAGFFEKIGFPAPMVVGLFITALELFGGVLLIAGLLTRYVAVLFFVEFIVAAYVKWVVMTQGFTGARIDLMILASAILFATNGAGSYSVDAKIGRG